MNAGLWIRVAGIFLSGGLIGYTYANKDTMFEKKKPEIKKPEEPLIIDPVVPPKEESQPQQTQPITRRCLH
jgi:hypothetical protein